MSYVKLDVKINYKQAIDDYNRLINQLNKQAIDLKINPTSGKITQKVLKEAVTSTGDLTKKTESLGVANKKATDTQDKLNKKAKESNGIFSNLGKTLSHNFGKMLEWSIAGTAIFGTLRKIREGVQYIKEMDSALANIRMASGLTREETSGLAQDYLNLGKELGIAVEEIANSATELYRQGLNTEEVNARLADYIKLSRVLGRDLQSTIELGTAATNSFGVSIQKVGDIATAVGDATASSGDEIMIAIQKSASAAQTAGVSLEELSAMAATVSARTRESGAIVGNSMKSILSKLSQVNAMTGEINDDFGKTLTTMKKVGAKITDDSGNLLDATDILNNLSGVWDTLSKKEQQYVSSSFGIYQVNRFSALLKGMTSNSEQYIDNLETAYNSFGSVAEKYEEYSNTITAATERMNNEFKELFQNTISSDFVITVVNATGSLIDLVDKTNLLQFSLIGLISYFALTKVAMLTAFIVPMAGVMSSIIGTIALTGSLSAGLKVLAMNAGAAGAMMNIAFVGVIAVTAGLVYAFRTADEELKKTRSSAEQATATFESHRKSVIELAQGMSDLKDKQKLTREEQIKLEGTYKSLLKIMPSIQGYIEGEALSWDNVTSAILKASEAEQQFALQQLRIKKSNRQINISEGNEALTKVTSDNFGIKSAIESTVKQATAQRDAIQVEIDKLEKEKITLTDFDVATGNDTPVPTYEDDSKVKKSSIEDLLKAFASYRQEIEKTEVEISLLEAKEEMLRANEEDYTGAIREQIAMYKEKQDEIHKYADALRLAQEKYVKGSEEWNKFEDEIIDQQQAWTETEKSIAGCTDEINDYIRGLKEASEKASNEVGKKMTAVFKKIEDLLDKQQKKMEARYDKRIQRYEDELEALKRKNEELEKEEEREKLLLAVEEARLRLANVRKEKNVQLYTGQGATGWEWIADPATVKAAEEEFQDATQALHDFDVEEARNAEEQKLQDKINRLERAKQAEVADYEARKEKLAEFQTQIEEAIENHETIKDEWLQGWRDLLTEKEQESFAERLDQLDQFVADYNALLAQLNDIPSMPGGGGGGHDPDQDTMKDVYGDDYYDNTKVGEDGLTDATREVKRKIMEDHPDSVGGGRAGGGSVSAGRTYRVNEAGIEGLLQRVGSKDYLTPLANGKVITANGMKGLMGGGDTINISNITLPNVQNAQDFYEGMKQFSMALRRKPTTA